MLKSAEQGNAEAQNTLGYRYYKGIGLPKDETAAYKWLHKSAEQGYKYAEDNLCHCYGDKLDMLKGIGDRNPANPIAPLRGSKEDVAAAFNWCGKAAKKGLISAKTRVGLLYARGSEEVQPDYEKSYFWFSVQKRPPPIKNRVENQLTPERVIEIKEEAKNWKPETDNHKP